MYMHAQVLQRVWGHGRSCSMMQRTCTTSSFKKPPFRAVYACARCMPKRVQSERAGPSTVDYNRVQ